jgi:hypothetical protein
VRYKESEEKSEIKQAFLDVNTINITTEKPIINLAWNNKENT